jgi:DNA-binding NtrC family response regulator
MALPENVTTHLRSLLFSRDHELVSLIGEVLKTLDIDVSRCSMAQEAVQKLASTKFDAIIVDNADAPGAVAVLSAAKSLESCDKSIGIVLAVSLNSIGLAEGARSHMVLYRPLSADRLRNGIKSALGLRNEGDEARDSLARGHQYPGYSAWGRAGRDPGLHHKPGRRRGRTQRRNPFLPHPFPPSSFRCRMAPTT